MSMIVYEIRTRIYDELLLADEPDPMAEAEGVELFSLREYITAAMLPVLARRAVVEAYSPASDQPIPVALWSERMKAEADELLARAGGWWVYGIWLPAILCGIIGFFLWAAWDAAVSREMQAQQLAYRTEPQAGDVIIGYVTAREDTENGYLTPFKIVRVEDEAIVVLRGLEKRPRVTVKFPGMWQEALRFDLAKSMFSGEEERYSRRRYQDPDPDRTPELRDPSLPYRNRADIIFVKYIFRPGDEK